jgi:outer membrane protein insertion porin family
MFRRLLPLLFLLSLSVAAQRGEIAAKLATMHVEGTVRYSEADVLATLPLKVGQTVKPDQFKSAADQLLDSGAFQRVGYEYKPAASGYALTFKVQDEARWFKISFGNFLWFTPDQLNNTILAAVPLYRGELPIDGSMTDKATAALQQLVAQRGIPGRVRFLPKASLGGPVTGGKFLIDGVDVKITQVDIVGGGPEQKALEQEAAERLLNNSYEQDETGAIAELNLLPVAERDGYLRAKLGDVEAKLTNADVQHPTVGLTIPVTLGEQYKLSDIVISGNQIFSADDIRKQIKLKNGAPANGVQLHNDLDDVKKLYGTRGYLMAQANAEPDINDAGHTVVYRIQMKEGEQFHMGSLQITGVNPEGIAKLTSLWKLKPGDAYSTEYVKEYLRDVSPLIPHTAAMNIASKVNNQAKTVDVMLKFSTRQAAR